ncbi:hypothetical protein [Pantoea rwandensis]|uniref:DUF3899 domain-containing protein n=1 Tax=Pantoea rwandensis TaxID=1076550 RepID=A0ABM5RH84_9GAMM|nr:hypothetical protein [Pantoea rwandensis]AIR85248.1 hypothetical protein LH22_07105 [Pantoea rwandensis]
MKCNITNWICFGAFFLVFFSIRFISLSHDLHVSGFVFLAAFVYGLYTYIVVLDKVNSLKDDNKIVKALHAGKLISNLKKGNEIGFLGRNVFFFTGFTIGMLLIRYT